MNEISTTRTIETVTAEIVAIRDNAQRVLLSSAVEVGRRLIEAKALLPHGEWGRWMDGVGYSQKSAERMMALFEGYGDKQGSFFGASVKSTTLSNLSISNALRLLAVPEDEREEFAEANNAADISARELEKIIRERDAAEKRAADIAADRDAARERAADAAKELAARETELGDAKARVKELERRPVEVAVQAPDPEDIRREAEKIAAEGIAAAEKQRAKELAALQKKLKAAETREREAQAKAAEDARNEAAELRRKLTASDGTAAAVNAYVQSALVAVNKAFEIIDGADGELRGKLCGALGKLGAMICERAGA